MLHAGEWWKEDTETVINQAMQLGVGPNISDSHTINGHPGPLSECASSQGNTLALHEHETDSACYG